jgi:hypothetical protein
MVNLLLPSVIFSQDQWNPGLDPDVSLSDRVQFRTAEVIADQFNHAIEVGSTVMVVCTLLICLCICLSGRSRSAVKGD